MSVVAFLYEEYYMWTCVDNFRGQFDDVDEAKELLRGTRYEEKFLETMDLETFQWTRWEWEPDYDEKDITTADIEEYKEKYEALVKSSGDHPSKILIEKHPYPRKADVEFFDYTYLTTNINYQGRMKYLAGHWKRI